jgi:phage/plasmid-associated DNA primase
MIEKRDTEARKTLQSPIKTKTVKVDQTINGTPVNLLQTMVSLQEDIPIYFDRARNYWLWNDELNKYERVDETAILVQISASMDLAIYNSSTKQEILDAIRLTGRQRRIQPTPKEWIQFENCVFNIETGETFQATPDYFFAAPIPHKLGNSTETPIIDGLFKGWNKEKAAYLYEICAYCLYDAYPIQRIFCFVGSGSNGKGQFMKLLRLLIGEENCAGTDLDRLAKSQFEASKLYKKKVAFIGETNYSTLSRMSKLEALSGGDLLSCEFKGRDSFNFVNTAKIITAMNELPKKIGGSYEFYRRWDVKCIFYKSLVCKRNSYFQAISHAHSILSI